MEKFQIPNLKQISNCHLPKRWRIRVLCFGF
jgi:hypothetical protein